MFTTRRDSWGWSRWILLAFLLLGVATLSVVQFSHRSTLSQPGLLQSPLPNKMAMDSAIAAASAKGQFMSLDPTGRFLINSGTRKPVFITGEAAWSLLGQLSDPNIEAYLSDRASKGFNLIIVDLVENYYSDHPPKDFYGNVPFSGADFTNENEVYWSRVDYTLLRAAAYGITVLADPAFVGYGCTGGYCTSYRNSSTGTLTAYGQYLGTRYKRFPNIVWLIGGDADPADSNVQSKLAALANGIKSADTVHLMTTENYRGTSSVDVWSGTSWLDLNALYSLPKDIPTKANTEFRAAAYPVFLMEDWYEGEHSTVELDVRAEGYWAVLSGCTLGRIFGNYAIWRFDWFPDTTASWKNRLAAARSGGLAWLKTFRSREQWKSQLGAAGSVGQANLGKLFRSRQHWMLVPDMNHTVMTAGYGSGSMLSVAARTADKQTVIAYVPNGSAATITVAMSTITDAGSQAKCWWFNPRDGSSTLIGSCAASGTRNFTPPDKEDWVLVIDSLAANLPAPGSKDL